MPVQHFVAPAMRLVITLCWGEVLRDEVINGLEKLSLNPDFNPDFAQLTDLSQVSKLNLGFNDMDVIHCLHDPFSNVGKRAVVAPGHDALYGLARMYQLLVDHEHFEVFHLLPDAVSWVGLEITAVAAAMRKAVSQRHAGNIEVQQLGRVGTD